MSLRSVLAPFPSFLPSFSSLLFSSSLLLFFSSSLLLFFSSSLLLFFSSSLLLFSSSLLFSSLVFFSLLLSLFNPKVKSVVRATTSKGPAFYRDIPEIAMLPQGERPWSNEDSDSEEENMRWVGVKRRSRYVVLLFCFVLFCFVLFLPVSFFERSFLFFSFFLFLLSLLIAFFQGFLSYNFSINKFFRFLRSLHRRNSPFPQISTFSIPSFSFCQPKIKILSHIYFSWFSFYWWDITLKNFGI